MSKLEVLKGLSFGKQVAEDESDDIAAYFVQTDSWHRIYDGEIDIIYGAKGAGKSAIYLLIHSCMDELFDRGVLLVTAENVRGAPAFKDIVVNPPTSELEFINLWKLYLLTLSGQSLRDFGITSESSRVVIRALEDAGLLPQGPITLSGRLRLVQDYVASYMKWEAVEGGVNIDPVSGIPVGLTGKIIFREPGIESRKRGLVSADELFSQVNNALEEENFIIWLLLDRLDVAFSETSDLEKNALRALFRAYRDISQNDRVKAKIFLRTDIWNRITEEGFREASHITRTVDLKWNSPSLRNLVIRRLLNNPKVIDYYGVDKEEILQDAEKQEEIFYRVFPDQVDTGPRQSSTFDWLMSRTSDGTGATAPRELIALLNSVRDVEVERLERGEQESPGEALFDRADFRAALPSVSKYRLEQTLYAEYPQYKKLISVLSGEKTEQTAATLAGIWGVSEGEALANAARLVEIGFFEQRGSREQPSYWVPFLYRPALDLVQGKAD